MERARRQPAVHLRARHRDSPARQDDRRGDARPRHVGDGRRAGAGRSSGRRARTPGEGSGCGTSSTCTGSPRRRSRPRRRSSPNGCARTVSTLHCPDFNQPDFEHDDGDADARPGRRRRWPRFRRGRWRSSGRAWAGSWRITPPSGMPPPAGGRGTTARPIDRLVLLAPAFEFGRTPFGGLSRTDMRPVARDRSARVLPSRARTGRRAVRYALYEDAQRYDSAALRCRYAGARLPGAARHGGRSGDGAAVRRVAPRDERADGRRRPSARVEPGSDVARDRGVSRVVRVETGQGAAARARKPRRISSVDATR